MTCYKLVYTEVNFHFMRSAIENMVQRQQQKMITAVNQYVLLYFLLFLYPKILFEFCSANRRILSSLDIWHGLNLTDIEIIGVGVS